MRKIAKRIKMTAANLYNYFTHKYELYVELIVNGFNLLYQQLNEAINSQDDDFKKIEALLKTYINFGINNAQYFDLMFNRAISLVGSDLMVKYFTAKQDVTQIEKSSINNDTVPALGSDLLARYLTDKRELSLLEKKSKKKVTRLGIQTMRDYINSNPELKGEEGEFIFLELWCRAHGLISLYNSGILSENFKNFEIIIEKMIERILLSFGKKD